MVEFNYNGLACLKFNMALETAVRNSGIQSAGTLLYRLVQVLRYADDLERAERHWRQQWRLLKLWK